MPWAETQNHVLSLYRSYLRQVNQLPQPYLRHFFRLTGRDATKVLICSRDERLKANRIASMEKRIRLIQRANAGNHKPFGQLLSLAYGRRGKLWHELMEPIVATDERAEPLVPGVDNLRPPVYSPALKALLLSPHARSTKPVDRSSLKHPPTLSERAKPSSEMAKTHGGLSKRLEVNTRKRYYTAQCDKVLPPIQYHAQEGQLTLGTESMDLWSQIHDVVGSFIPSNDGQQATGRPSRWLRRRYRMLLREIPKVAIQPTSTDGRLPQINFTVELSPATLLPEVQKAPSALPEMGAAEWSWVKNMYMKDPKVQVQR